MDKISTYALVGIPEQLAITFTLIALALALAPWVEGIEIGPLKVPKLSIGQRQFLRIVGPIAFLILMIGFAKTWSIAKPAASTLPEMPTGEEYRDRFFSKDWTKLKPFKKPLVLDEMATEGLMSVFGGSEWNGGTHWGKVVFDSSGRRATYTNGYGRSPGRILLQTPVEGTVPLTVGEWWQDDGQEGLLIFHVFFRPSPDVIIVKWGPEFLVEEEWSRTSRPVD